MKKLNAGFIIIGILIMLASCKTGTLNEKKIAKIIPDEITIGMDVEKVKIEKRQTNGKEDIVYAIIDMKNKHIHRTAYCILTINYYDTGGWIVDHWEKYQSFISFPLTPPSLEVAYEAVEKKYSDYKIKFKTSNTDDFKNGNSVFEFDVISEKNFITFSGDVIINMFFSEEEEKWISTLDSIHDSISETWKYEKFIGEWEANWKYNKGNLFASGKNLTNESLKINITAINSLEIETKGHLIADDNKWSDYFFDGEYTLWTDDQKRYNNDDMLRKYFNIVRTESGLRSTSLEWAPYYRLYFTPDKICINPAGFYFQGVDRGCIELNKID